MKVGILGGRFDPVHIGHLIVARDVKEILGLEKMIFLVSHNPPHKSAVADFKDRFNMVNLAVKPLRGFTASQFEKQLNLPKSYTVEVLKELKNLFPQDTFYFLIGMDQYSRIQTWYKPMEIFKYAYLVVMERKGCQHTREKIHPKVIFVRQREIEISSTEIRQRVAQGKSIKYLVPDAVESYIKRNKLYMPVKTPVF